MKCYNKDCKAELTASYCFPKARKGWKYYYCTAEHCKLAQRQVAQEPGIKPTDNMEVNSAKPKAKEVGIR